MKSWCVYYVFLCLLISLSSALGVDDADMDTSVQSFIKEFQSLRNRVSVLESVIEKQTEIIQVQNDRIVKLEAVVMSVSFHEDDVENYSLHDVDHGTNQTRDIDTQSNSLELVQHITKMTPQEGKPNRAVRQVAVQPVAFYAYMSGHLKNPGGLHTLIFDVTKTNEGNGYHAHLGAFMVPKSGTYFFSWTMNLEASSSHSTELVVNNQPHGAIFHRSSHEERNSDTGNLILNLNGQDEVFIRTRGDGNYGMIVSDAYGRTSFSGFLIE